MNCNECEKNCLSCEGIDNDLRLKITEIIKKVSERRKEKSLSKQLEEVIENLPSVAQQEIQKIFFQRVIIASLLSFNYKVITLSGE